MTFLKALFLIIILSVFPKLVLSQDSASTKLPMYYKLDSTTDSITEIGERPRSVPPDSVKVFVDKSFPISGYIIIPLIVGLILSAFFMSIGRRKEINFKRWNIKNRENLKNKED